MIHSFYFIIAILLTSFASPLIAQETTDLSQKHMLHAQVWINHLAESVTSSDVQIAANVLYLLYANALIDVKIRQFIIPITRLNQSIRSNITYYRDTTKDLSTLKVLLERLSHVIGARTIYNQKLQTCLNYYNTHQMKNLNQYIIDLQGYGQVSLNECAEYNSLELSSLLKASAKNLNAAVQPLQEISQVHESIANGSVSESLKNDDSTKNFAAILTIEELYKNNLVATENAEHVLNTLDTSTESALQLILSATDIYKYHYQALYEYISADSFDKQYATTLFGMNDVLPEEFKTVLPHPDKVFEHVLQTIKLYTQIELTQ